MIYNNILYLLEAVISKKVAEANEIIWSHYLIIKDLISLYEIFNLFKMHQVKAEFKLLILPETALKAYFVIHELSNVCKCFVAHYIFMSRRHVLGYHHWSLCNISN